MSIESQAIFILHLLPFVFVLLVPFLIDLAPTPQNRPDSTGSTSLHIESLVRRLVEDSPEHDTSEVSLSTEAASGRRATNELHQRRDLDPALPDMPAWMAGQLRNIGPDSLGVFIVLVGVVDHPQRTEQKREVQEEGQDNRSDLGKHSGASKEARGDWETQLVSTLHRFFQEAKSCLMSSRALNSAAPDLLYQTLQREWGEIPSRSLYDRTAPASLVDCRT